MKNLRQLCAALVLALTFALTAFAGNMSTTVVPPPPQAATQGEMSTTVAGEIPTDITATDLAAEITLPLLQSVLSLF